MTEMKGVSMLRGIMAGSVVVLTEDGSGKPIMETDQIDPPEGYRAVPKWIETQTSIAKVWELEPIEGTAQDAAVRLTMLQAQSLPDDAALSFVALYPEWVAGETYAAEQRVKYKGVLYKVLQGHVSQADWAPDTAASLFAKVLLGQDGNEPADGSCAEWEQPGSTNGYSKGDRVAHNGKLWESQVDNNTWEPGGAGVYENIWKEVRDESETA